MKLRNLMWGACACILAAGCSNDDVAVDNGNNVLTNGGEAYVKVRIAMADGAYSRSATEGDYDYGTDEDHVIKTLYFGFYNADGSWAAAGRNYSNLSTTGKEDDPVGNIDATLDEAVIALELDENSPFPTQMVAYVNITADDFANKINGKSLSEARTATFEGNVADDTNGFIMTNSTYLDANNKEKIATEVTDANFFEDPDIAKTVDPVDIYVERLAVKITVKSTVQSVDPETAGEYTLSFEPKGYVVSGTNTKEYFLKNIDESWNTWTWNWNKASEYRCFWAKDPNYESMENAGLSYKSYNDAYDHALDVPQYCMENTLTSTLAASDGYNAYTHLLMVGQYIVKKGNDEIELSTESDGYLYMFAGTAYLANDIKARLLDQAADNELAFSDQQGTQVDETHYSIIRIDGTNTITLKLNEPDAGTTYYTRSGSEGNYTYTPITDYDGEEGYNAKLAEYLTNNVGKPEAFANGEAYFVVPIEHFGSVGETGEIGVVRNHSYVLTINKITGIGEGIFDPTEPIEPNPQTKKYYVAATLNILSWKTVSQNVSFGN